MKKYLSLMLAVLMLLSLAVPVYADEPATAQGEGNGIDGKIVVEVKADAEKIYEVNILEQNETPGIGSVAVEKLPGAIVEANSLEVDGITGATVSSTAIKTAVTEALTSMGFDPAAYAGAAAPAAEAAPAEKEAVTLDCDVVVVGAGGAGMTAAITASDEGANVIILESTSFPGGNSVRSTGGMNAGPTEWRNMNEFGEAAGVEATLKKVANYPDNERIQELGKIVEEQWAAYQADPQGYFDTSELFQLDTLIGGGGMNDPALVKKLVESSPDAIDWLDSLDPEIVLHNVAAFGGASVKRIHRPVDENGKVVSVGAYVVPLLQQNLEKRGIKLLTDTPATEILMDNGQAVGVKAEGPDASYTINAKAVVIASGGFGANNDMIKAVRPDLDGFITTNAPGIQGQGIQMAQAVGADTVDMEQIQLHPTVHVEGTSANLITEGLRGDGAILVNQEGERFFDEVSTRDKVSAAEFEQIGGYAWLIIDSRMYDKSNVIQGYVNKGFAETGDTYVALADAIGAPAEAFVNTMINWNACVEQKSDPEFGRVSFANPLDQAPFYAIKVQPGVHHTMGGIKINDNAQVIDTDGNVIAGLFAAGEVTGGVHGNNRLGGNAVADFTIFGRIAGQSASDFAKGGASEEAAPAEAAATAADGVASAQGQGIGIDGPVVVEVKADANKIYEVNILQQNETPGIGSVAVEKLPGAIVEANSLEVDGITGATVSSTAIKTAVTEALTAMGFDPASYAGAAAPAEEAAPAEKNAETLDCDVVVIGAGGAGMTAAITASDEGANVIILESTSFPGGNSVRSTGGMNAGPTEWRNMNEFGEAAGVEATLKKVANYPDNERIQELGKIVEEQWAAYQADPQGYFDTSELFQLDTLIGGGGMNDPALVKKLVESSPDAIDWLDSLDPEIVLHNVAAFGGASVKRIHRPVDENGKVVSVGAYVVPLLQQNLEKRGIKLLTDTPATEILMDNGAAVGVKAEGPDASYTINAKAVVIASGGFGANNDMIKAVRPDLDGFITTNAPGIQGQGIRMAQAVGADTVDMEQIQLHPTVHVEGTSANLITEGLRGDGAILVNQEGERFFDEVSTRDKVSAAEFEQTGGYAWLIVDSRMSDASNVIQGYINKGYAETGDTVEALAEAIGAPAETLVNTMTNWNACVEQKSDPEFGRVSFANPLDQAPFYAIKVQPGIHHTMGGIKINDNAQVIDTDGNVIAGLFAAGEVTGGVHGNNRLGGNAVADFTIYGRIAGQNAADLVAGDLPVQNAA